MFSYAARIDQPIIQASTVRIKKMASIKINLKLRSKLTLAATLYSTVLSIVVVF
jgi:hypothetical protein